MHLEICLVTCSRSPPPPFFSIQIVSFQLQNSAMKRIYQFFLDVVSTVKDGASFVFSTAATTLKRTRDQDSGFEFPPNPLATGPPILPLQKCSQASQNATTEERPSKRRRLNSTTAAPVCAGSRCRSKWDAGLDFFPQSTVSVTLNHPVVSALSSPKPIVTRPLYNISKRPPASASQNQNNATCRLPYSSSEETRLYSDQRVDHKCATDETLHLQHSAVSPNELSKFPVTCEEEPSMSSETPVPVQSFFSATETILKRIERSAAGANSNFCIHSGIPQTTVLLAENLCSESFVDSRRQVRSQKIALRQKIDSPYALKRSSVLYPQAQRFVPASPRRRFQSQPSDSLDSE